MRALRIGMAVDHADRVAKLALLDIAPTLDMYTGNWGPAPITQAESSQRYMTFARYYYHWFHLPQPSPLPEKMIGADARFYLHTKLGGWGAKGLAHIEPEALADYERCFCRAESIHAACEDYRAGAGIDLEHDRDSRAKGERIACDTLVLIGANGLIAKLWDAPVLWQAQCARRVTSATIEGGHFFAEEAPEATAAALRSFFG